MDLRLHSVTTNEILTRGYSEQRYESSGKYVLIEPNEDIVLEFGRNKVILQRGCIAIGTNFRISNVQPHSISIRAVVFSTNKDQSQLKNPVILSGNDKNFESIINQIVKVFEVQSLSGEQFQETIRYLSELLERIDTTEEKQKGTLYGKIDPRLIRINRFIRKHYHEQLTLNCLADLIQCNPGYLSNTYARIFRKSPMKHLQMVRMMKARELLETTDVPVGEITQAVGYISNSQFSSYFKKHIGTSPMEYRKNNRMEKGGGGFLRGNKPR